METGAVRFRGEVALITGAGSGIGRAVALGLAREESGLVLCGRRAGPLEAVARDCAGHGAQCLVFPLDVRKERAIARAFDRAESGPGPVGVAVACHGINILSRVEQMPPSTWREIIDTNLTGSFLLAREASRRMRVRGRGRIVLVSSVSGRPGHMKFPGFAAYAASKYGLTGLFEVLSVELEGSGVEPVLICPGGVDTEMFRKTFPGALAPLTAGSVAEEIVSLADSRTPLPPGGILEILEPRAR